MAATFESSSSTRNPGCDNSAGSNLPRDAIEEASDESFPASDAPSWTPVTGSGSPWHAETHGTQSEHQGSNEADPLEIAREWEASQAAEVISALAAVWLMLSPFMFEFSLIRAAMWNSLAVGSVLLVLAIIRLGNLDRYVWPSFLLSFLLAGWLVGAPYMLGYADVRAPFLNSVLAGVVVFVMALWSVRDAPARAEPKS